MTEQEARDDEREALWREYARSQGLSDDYASWRNGTDRLAFMAGYAARRHPEPEITEDAVVAAYHVFDDNGSTPEAMRLAIEAALRVPVGEGERGCPFCDEVRRMDATYGSQIGVCVKHRTQPVPPAAPDSMPRIGGEPA